MLSAGSLLLVLNSMAWGELRVLKKLQAHCYTNFHGENVKIASKFLNLHVVR